MENGECRICKFFENINLEPGQGRCRRYPPVPFLVKTGLGSNAITCYFPMTQEKWVCGEFQPAIQMDH